MAQKLITFLPEADRKYKSDTLSSILSASSVNRILANPNDRTLWINGWPFGHTFVSQNAAKPQPTNAEVFNFYTQFDANGNVIEGNAAYGNYSNAFGFNTVANNDFETAIGSLNYSIPSDYTAAKTSIFTIGIGDPSNYATMLNDAEYIPGATIPKDNNAYRKNALLVTKDGSIYLKNTSEIINSKNVEYTPCGYAGGPLTGNEKSLQRIVSDTMKLKAVTYAELISLRSLGQLVPGMKYRITDYRTRVSANQDEGEMAYIKAAQNLFMFDIIVEAISETKLSKLAKATYPTGVSNSRISDSIHEWQLWYTLDNDKEIFPWADTRASLGYFTVQYNDAGPVFHGNDTYLRPGKAGEYISSYGDIYIDTVLKDPNNGSSWFKSSSTDAEGNTTYSLLEARANKIKTYRDFVYYDSYDYVHNYTDADGSQKSVNYTQRWLPCADTNFIIGEVFNNIAYDTYTLSNARENSAADYYCALTEFLEPKIKEEGFKNILICINETTQQINDNDDNGSLPSELDIDYTSDYCYDLSTLKEYKDKKVDLVSTGDKTKAELVTLNKNLKNQINYTFLAPDKLKVTFVVTDSEYKDFIDAELEERYYLYDGQYYGSKFLNKEPLTSEDQNNKTYSYYKWIRTDSDFNPTATFGLNVNTAEEVKRTIHRTIDDNYQSVLDDSLITEEQLTQNIYTEYLVTKGYHYDKCNDTSLFENPEYYWKYEEGRTPYPGTAILGSYLSITSAKRLKSIDFGYEDDSKKFIATTEPDDNNTTKYFFRLSEGGKQLTYTLDTSDVFEYNDTTYMKWFVVEDNEQYPVIITSPGTDMATLAKLQYANTDEKIQEALLSINFDDDGDYGSWLLYPDLKMNEVSGIIYHCENSAYSVIRLSKTIVEPKFEGYIPEGWLGGYTGYNFGRLYDKYSYKQADYYEWVLLHDGQTFEQISKEDYIAAGIKADILSTGNSFINKTLKRVDSEGKNHYATLYYEPEDLKIYFHTYIEPLCKATAQGAFISTKYEGTGIITRMIDEYGNDCPYDFKNIMLADGTNYYYTFSSTANSDNNVQDATLSGNCKNNVIKFSSLKAFPKTIFNSTSFIEESVLLDTPSRDPIGGELPEGTEVPEDDNTEVETVETQLASDIMNNTVINCDNLVISNNCVSSTFSNVTDTRISREIYNSMFKNVSLGDDGSNDGIPYYCSYYNGESNIINGIEKNISNSSQVKTTMFTDDQVLFSGDNAVIFTKSATINNKSDFDKYVGSASVKTISGKTISVSKREPSTGTRNWESLNTSYNMSSPVTLFDFSSLSGGSYSLKPDSSGNTYNDQTFFGGYFVVDVGYRYENKWLCNHVVSNTSMTLQLFLGDASSSFWSLSAASGSATMPWDKSDHTTGMRLFWKVPDTIITNINSAISSGTTIKAKLTSGYFTMSTNSNSCYAITIDNFSFIPKGNSKLDDFKDSDGNYRSSGVIFGYSGVSGMSNAKITATTTTGTAVIICGNGIAIGKSGQAKLYTGSTVVDLSS